MCPQILNLELRHALSLLRACGIVCFQLVEFHAPPHLLPAWLKRSVSSQLNSGGTVCLSGRHRVDGTHNGLFVTAVLELATWPPPAFVLLFQRPQHEPLLARVLALLCGAHGCHLFDVLLSLKAVC